MIPVLEALRTLLLSDAAIVAAVTDRISGPQRTMALTTSIVLQRAGGRIVSPKTRPRTFVRCHATDLQQAEALYRLLFPVFYDTRGEPRGMRTIGGKWLLYWGQLTEPDTSIEPDSGWPVAAGVLETEWAVQALV